MVSEEFLEKLKGKTIHVDYWDTEEKEFAWEEGILDEFDNLSLEIVSDTTFNKIFFEDIKTVYLKEKK